MESKAKLKRGEWARIDLRIESLGGCAPPGLGRLGNQSIAKESLRDIRRRDDCGS
jgi:hypothetical protein